MPEMRKPFWRRLLEFRLLFVINGIVLVVLGYSFGREWVRNHEIQQEIASLQDKAESLQAKNLELADLNTAFRTQSFIEREARLKLGLKRPGENVVIIDGDSSSSSVQTPPDEGVLEETNDPRSLLAAEDSSQEATNPVKWWRYFFE